MMVFRGLVACEQVAGLLIWSHPSVGHCILFCLIEIHFYFLHETLSTLYSNVLSQ